MIKKIAWNTFKQTGDIGTYLELKQFEQIENDFFQTNIDKAVDNFWNNINKE